MSRENVWSNSGHNVSEVAGEASTSKVKKQAQHEWRVAGVVVASCGVLFFLYLAATKGLLPMFKPEGPLAKSMDQLKEQAEQAYWENVGFDMDALSNMPKDTFAQKLVMVNGLGYRQKFIWDYFLPHYSCPQKEKVGTQERDGDCGKWLCGVRSLLQRPGCVVYSFGSNGDVSFEKGIINRTACQVHVFDPTLTPDQKRRVQNVPGIHLHEYGLGKGDGVMDTMGRQSMTGGKGTHSFAVKSLPTIMQELGHTWVDVLKIDIEGQEWDVLDLLLKAPGALPFTQMQVEYHNFNDNIVSPVKMLEVLARMITKDMRVFNVEPNLWGINNGYDFVEYAYLQVNKQGDVVASPKEVIREAWRGRRRSGT